MVKNKDWPDSAAPPLWSLSLCLCLFLSLSLADAVHPEGTPGSCRGWTPASGATNREPKGNPLHCLVFGTARALRAPLHMTGRVRKVGRLRDYSLGPH